MATSNLYPNNPKPADTAETHGFLRPELNNAALPIVFNDVEFSYPSRPNVPILKGLFLSIAPSETVALVGSSGCGKSTIAQLIQQLYEPSSGSVQVAGIDTRTMDIQHLHQHPNLFNASVADNVAYGNSSLSEVGIRKAAKAVNMHDWVMLLEHGYDTVIGENASQLLGGQAQRLQIARALARPCGILILNECTNRKGRTTIMVTHKVPALQMCDRILVVDNGRIVEEGKIRRANAAQMRVCNMLASGARHKSLGWLSYNYYYSIDCSSTTVSATSTAISATSSPSSLDTSAIGRIISVVDNLSEEDGASGEDFLHRKDSVELKRSYFPTLLERSVHIYGFDF
ncbi:P-loop containing nucleoside triphosphate hydrolase protein [Gymnopus androsaceus JB14]|uniref:P-loop containing nucleoside triphosphate hydrolase protein n=1 Tax=Gymnopus androsaceus JB14 TaxID=1447944 RepID=A0A6A4GF60_9AGAR|nr:P-loop containing nucleoside triphosphate hydrolase protein [Gymnopus androsaceus JB14]